jgi:hypothetical protein
MAMMGYFISFDASSLFPRSVHMSNDHLYQSTNEIVQDIDKLDIFLKEIKPLVDTNLKVSGTCTHPTAVYRMNVKPDADLSLLRCHQYPFSTTIEEKKNDHFNDLLKKNIIEKLIKLVLKCLGLQLNNQLKLVFV